MRRWLVVGLLLSSLAQAQSLAEAQALYADGELSRALKAADAALKTAQSTDRAPLHVLRGLVLLAQNKKSGATAAFGQALEADPATQLDPQRVPPEAAPLFEQAREKLPPGTVTVSAAGEAELRVDGVAMGPLPLTTRLTVGRHTLEATTSQGKLLREEVLVRSGVAQTVSLAAAAPIAEAPPPTPPLVSPEEPKVEPKSDVSMANATSATLLTSRTEPVKQQYWGLIPMGVAFGAGWMVPALAANPQYLGLSITLTILTAATIGLGVGLLAASAVEVERSSGAPGLMNWWGLLPLGLGLVGLVTALVAYESLGSYNGISFVGLGSAMVFGGIGAGMLVGRAIGVHRGGPKVAFIALPSGIGVSLAGQL